jgi:hypothetical protein
MKLEVPWLVSLPPMESTQEVMAWVRNADRELRNDIIAPFLRIICRAVPSS